MRAGRTPAEGVPADGNGAGDPGCRPSITFPRPGSDIPRSDPVSDPPESLSNSSFCHGQLECIKSFWISHWTKEMDQWTSKGRGLKSERPLTTVSTMRPLWMVVLSDGGST
ncbi:uncharacterized protein AB9W97_007991 [Spinachia spinachia]